MPGAENWLSGQIFLFFAALVAGMLAGAVYRLYRALLGSKRRARRRYLLPDAVFSLLTTLLLIFFWFRVTDGTLLFSSFLVMAAGFLFCRRLPQLPRHRVKDDGRQTQSPPSAAAGGANARPPSAGKTAVESAASSRHSGLLRLASRPALRLLRQQRRMRLRLAERRKAKASQLPPDDEN